MLDKLQQVTTCVGIGHWGQCMLHHFTARWPMIDSLSHSLPWWAASPELLQVSEIFLASPTRWSKDSLLYGKSNLWIRIGRLQYCPWDQALWDFYGAMQHYIQCHVEPVLIPLPPIWGRAMPQQRWEAHGSRYLTLVSRPLRPFGCHLSELLKDFQICSRFVDCKC